MTRSPPTGAGGQCEAFFADLPPDLETSRGSLRDAAMPL